MTEVEPGGWELRRAMEQLRSDSREGFASLNARLDKVVSADAFAAEQRRVDDKLKDLAADISDERVSRRVGDDAQQTALDKLVSNQRYVVAAIMIPIGLFVASFLLR